MSQDDRIPTDTNDDGEYLPAGEQQGISEEFSAQEIAGAFGVTADRVIAALHGEFGLGPDASVNSRQAQQLAEVLIGDQPQDMQQAALMQLGAFTPRSDHDWGFGEKADGEESDRLVRNADDPDGERG